VPPAYTDAPRRRVNRDPGRGAQRAGLAKPAKVAGLNKASTTGEFPRVHAPSRVVEAGGIRTPNANTILPSRSVIETSKKNQLIDPKRIVDKALAGLEKATTYDPKVAAAGPRGILNIAKKYAGVPYKWGGTNPASGLDCSGYTQLVFRQAGINLPRVSRDQFAWASKYGKVVNGVGNARPGDLVFYSKNGSPSGIHHVGIYAGNGKYWNAPYTGQVVSLRSVGSPTYIRRVL
jgi:cell wall-associated NlpC family hydrolase